MDYHTLKIVYQYLHSNSYIFYALISKDCKDIINSIRKDNIYETKYEVLTSKSLLSYSEKNLKLVIDENVKEVIIKIGDLKSIKSIELYNSRFFGSFQSYEIKKLKNGYLLYAIYRGNLVNIKWLFDNGCPFCSYTFAYAACNGNLVNMKWLHSKGCEFGFNTFCESAFNGNLENMKWLYANGCPFDDNTFNSAARNGNLDNMKWLLENGCPFDHLTFASVMVT